MTSKAVSSAAKPKKAAPEIKSAAFQIKSSTSVTFGSVTVQVNLPTPTTIARNIEAGQTALSRARDALVKPGVKIHPGKGVPIFYGDAREPGVIIREVDGVKTRGRVVAGSFKAIPGPVAGVKVVRHKAKA